MVLSASQRVMATGWNLINGVWYYMNGSGEMQTGWQNISGRSYYLNNSGAMLTGWQRLNGRWYYLDGSGAMVTGWQALDGKWYYFGSDGTMYANTTTPDGRYVDGSGAGFSKYRLEVSAEYRDVSGGVLSPPFFAALTPPGMVENN